MKKIEEAIFDKEDFDELKELILKNKSRIKGRIGLLYAALHYEKHLQIELLDFLKLSGAPFDSEALSKALFYLLDHIGEAGNNKQYIRSSVSPIAEYLIKHGADANWRGGLPLRVAVMTHSKDLVSLLVRSGADVNLCPDDGSTALMYSCGNPERVGNGGMLWTNSDQKQEIVEFLINSGADVTIKNRRNRTALSLAKSADNYRVIDLLKELDKTGNWPVSLPPKKDGVEAIKVLIEQERETQECWAQSDSIDHGWPKDKKWLKCRRETWKHIQLSIKEFLGSNVNAKEIAALKRYFLTGEYPSDSAYGGIFPLFFVWLHASGDVDFFKKTFEKSDFRFSDFEVYWTRYYLFTTANAGKISPYGLFGPRTKIIVKSLYPFLYRFDSERGLSIKYINRAKYFVSYYFRMTRAFMGNFDNDPFNPCQYLFDEFIDNLRILNGADDISLDKKEVSDLLKCTESLKVDELPQYKRDAVRSFLLRFRPELDSGELKKQIEKTLAR